MSKSQKTLVWMTGKYSMPKTGIKVLILRRIPLACIVRWFVLYAQVRSLDNIHARLRKLTEGAYYILEK